MAGPAVGQSSPAPIAPLPSASAGGAVTVESDTTSGTIEATDGTWQLVTPWLAGPLDPAVLVAVNDALAAGAAADLAAFEASSTPPVDAAFPGDEFSRDFTVALLTPELLSLRVLAHQYASGAAHGATVFEPWTFDLRTGEQLGLADLFLPDADYLRPISAAARRQLLATYSRDEAPRQWVRDGTKPVPGNFTGWAMTPAGLEITFGEYQVAPYALGMPVAVIPWSELGDVLDPVGPAASLLLAPAPLGSPAPSASPGAVG
jgi:hypothetical protein